MLVQQNFIFASCFLWSYLLHVEKLLRRIWRNGCSFAKWQYYKRHISIWDTGWLAAFALLVPASYHQAADVAKANGQTGLASGSALTWAHWEIALGVYCLMGPTPPRVTLWSPWRVFPAVNEQRVAMTLAWPWWSLEGLILAGRIELATQLKKKVSIL